MPRLNLMREPATAGRVTNIELFFDLVYVFAVTQLSHYLLAHASVTGALGTGLLLAMVWQLWVYTTWVTNWLNPERIAVRLLLLGLTGASLVMSAALPGAFGSRGLAVGCAYAVMQIGRSVFAVIALRGQGLQRNFERILCWCLVSGALAVAGGFAAGGARVALWVAAVGVDLLGGIVGFYTPGLGRSTTHEWTIEGGHFAERCQGFVLIALGESILVIGVTLADPDEVGHAAASWLILGGIALFLAGHAAFKAVIWRRVPWTRIGAVAVLALLGLAAPHLSALALGGCTAAVVLAVAALDHALDPGSATAE
jgi:low temperature requirement protein LtrA